MNRSVNLFKVTSSTAEAPVTLGESAELPFPGGWYVGAEVCAPRGTSDQPVLAVWSADPQGWESGGSELDAAGVNQLLADVSRFAARLESLRAVLSAATGEAAGVAR